MNEISEEIRVMAEEAYAAHFRIEAANPDFTADDAKAMRSPVIPGSYGAGRHYMTGFINGAIAVLIDMQKDAERYRNMREVVCSDGARMVAQAVDKEFPDVEEATPESYDACVDFGIALAKEKGLIAK